jgi:hypothetical protein
MPIDPNIPLQFKPTTELQFRNPLAEYAQVQNILASQAQLKGAEYQQQKLQRDEDNLSKFYATVAEKGGPTDPTQVEQQLIQSKVPHFMELGIKARTTRLQLEAQRQRISNIMGNQMPTGAPAANESLALPTASTAPTTKFPTGMSLQDYTAGLATPSPYYQGANQLAANVTPTTTAAPVANAPVANALTPTVAPTPAPVVNALAAPVAGAPNISELRRRRDLLLQDGSPQAFEIVKSIDKDIALLSKVNTAAPGSVMYDSAGNIIRTVPAAPTPTTLSKLIKERDALPPNDPLRSLYNATIAKQATHAPGASVVMPPQEKAEQVEFGKFLVDQYKAIDTNANLAAKSIPALDVNLSLLNKGFDTGFGKSTQAVGAKVLAALGVPEAENFATNSQVFLASANNAVLQRQLEQKGPQTEADAQRITQTGAQLGNTKAANQFILTVAKAQLQRDIDRKNFYSDWRKEHKTFDGADNAWYAGEGGKSLFSRPDLKKYVDMGGGATAPTSPVRSQADAILKRGG